MFLLPAVSCRLHLYNIFIIILLCFTPMTHHWSSPREFNMHIKKYGGELFIPYQSDSSTLTWSRNIITIPRVHSSRMARCLATRRFWKQRDMGHIYSYMVMVHFCSRKDHGYHNQTWDFSNSRAALNRHTITWWHYQSLWPASRRQNITNLTVSGTLSFGVGQS